MHGKTVLVLILIVAVLGGVLWLREEPEHLGEGLSVQLFGDIDPAAVLSVRIENLERHTQVALERDGAGAWFLTDPVAYPAEPSVVVNLIEVAVGNLGLPVEEAELAELGLDPPRMRVELTWQGGDGTRTGVVEVGALGLGERDVYVRAGEAVLLTRRNFADAFERDPDAFRLYSVIPIDHRSIVEFRREGTLPTLDGGPEFNLDLAARLTSDGWVSDRPFEAQLDVHTLALVLRSATALRATQFLDDDPEQRLAAYGLADPAFRIHLTTSRGEDCEVLFGVVDDKALASGDWMCFRVGHPCVFRIPERAVLNLATDFHDLIDYRVSRAVREEVTSIDLMRPGRLIRFQRSGPAWLAEVSDLGPAGPNGVAAPVGQPRSLRADKRAGPGFVVDLLGAVEEAQLLELLPGIAWDPEEASGSIAVTTEDGRIWGGTFGPVEPGPGTPGQRFRRFGDSQVARVAEDLRTWVEVDELDLWHPTVHKLDPMVQTAITVSVSGRSSTYARNANGGQWLTEGQGREAPLAFSSRVDDLLHVRALQWLASDPNAQLLDPIAIELVDRKGGKGGTVSFLLGREDLPPQDARAAHPAGGRALYESNGVRAEVASGLHADLWELLAN